MTVSVRQNRTPWARGDTAPLRVFLRTESASAGVLVVAVLGEVRSRAWTWVFSSMQSTTAFSGGFRYSPTTSRTLASSSGSVENLNVSCRHGCRFHSRQIRRRRRTRSPTVRPAAARPVGHAQRRRRRLQGGHHDRGVVDDRRPPGPVQILQRPDTAGGVTVPPFQHSRAGHPDQPADRHVRHSLRGQQHDPGPLRHPGLHGRGPDQGCQFRFVTRTQYQRGSDRHAPFSQTPTVKSLPTRDTRAPWPSRRTCTYQGSSRHTQRGFAMHVSVTGVHMLGGEDMTL